MKKYVLLFFAETAKTQALLETIEVSVCCSTAEAVQARAIVHGCSLNTCCQESVQLEGPLR